MLSKSTWFSIHSWVGVKLSILLCFIVATGTLAVVSHEIDWLANSAKRVSPSSVSDMNWQAVYAQALTKTAQLTPPVRKIESIHAPLHPWFSAEVIYRDKDNQRHRLFFHPTTGEHLGDGRWLNWQRFLRVIHRHLMLPLTLGITIVSAFSIAILAVLISSLYIYRRWWKGFFRTPRWRHRQTRWGDLHRLVGVWSLWFLIVIGLTGSWYLAERWGAAAPSRDKGYAMTEAAMDAPIMPTQAAFITMLHIARAQFQALTIQEVRLPNKAAGVVVFQGQASAILVRSRANTIQFDPVSAEAVFKQDGNDLSLHTRISEAADPLHFGVWGEVQGSTGKLASKILYFLFGIFLTALCITGTYMYGLRVGRKVDSISSKNTPFGAWRVALKKMGWAAWLFATGIAACLGYGAYSYLPFGS
ncbi:PepSY-associated TM helix domain-containing protein [Alteromonas lipotrueae]|uniref:PepSY-associated TM helix domain-containing protein n=1 Tax=Alteromonas lipotrueae TaxID=2803814 RepID=UPI001C483CF8